MRRLFLAAVAALLLVSAGQAAPLELTAELRQVSLEGRLEHFADPSAKLSFEEARQEKFVLLPDFRSLGYDTAAHWFHVELRRAARAPQKWTLAIGVPDLEEVDIWAERLEGGFSHYALGYHRPYANRPLQTRLFAVPVELADHTHIYFRVHTTNAINVQAELWQPGDFIAHETRSNFHQGVYFGILLIAVVLYLVLGGWLRDLIMLAYAGYVASMALLHIGSLGYLPVLLTTPNAPWLTDTLPRLGWLGGAVFIVLMWIRLLDLKRNHPLVHRLYQFTILLNVLLLPFALVPSLVNAAVLVVVKAANILNGLNLFISMALLLFHWWRKRRAELMLYFVAFLIPVAGNLLNTAAHQGVLPWNALTSTLYEFAPLAHVLVMSFGLALRLRQMQQDKVVAEQGVILAAQRADEQRRFVAMLSHEFRNPLAAIDRSVQMVQIKAPELAEAETKRLGLVRGNVATLAGLVDNFLLAEALDHGGMAVAPEPCSISSLLEDVVQMQGEDAGARIAPRVEPSDAAYALDSNLMVMAVGNLVGNALRYSPSDSSVEVSATVDAKGLHIRVADRGPGMTTEELAMLGQPYYRAASSHGKKGSGLGYHFARRIVEAHGGSLQASSRPGGGMTVEIHLP